MGAWVTTGACIPWAWPFPLPTPAQATLPQRAGRERRVLVAGKIRQLGGGRTTVRRVVAANDDCLAAAPPRWAPQRSAELCTLPMPRPPVARGSSRREGGRASLQIVLQRR